MSGLTRARCRAHARAGSGPAARLLASAVASACVAASPSAGTAQQRVRALEAAAELYRDVGAMCADFEQTIEVRLARRTIESAGRVCQQRPNLFSMRFTDPDGDMVVSDGDFVWVYYPSLDAAQVNRHPASDAPGSQDFFRELLEDPGAKYEAEEEGTEAVAGRDCRVVALTPRAGAAYDRARLWLDAETHVIRRIEVHERSGNVRIVTLHGLDLSPTIEPGTFVFEVPEGARIRGALRRRGPAALP